MRRSREVASSLGRMLALGGALSCFACGTTLLATEHPFSEGAVRVARRGGLALGCHERASQLFPLFLVCPGDDRALGVARAQGKLAISCPDLAHRSCRKLFEEVRAAGVTEPSGVSPRAEER